MPLGDDADRLRNSIVAATPRARVIQVASDVRPRRLRLHGAAARRVLRPGRLRRRARPARPRLPGAGRPRARRRARPVRRPGRQGRPIRRARAGGLDLPAAGHRAGRRSGHADPHPRFGPRRGDLLPAARPGRLRHLRVGRPDHAALSQSLLRLSDIVLLAAQRGTTDVRHLEAVATETQRLGGRVEGVVLAPPIKNGWFPSPVAPPLTPETAARIETLLEEADAAYDQAVGHSGVRRGWVRGVRRHSRSDGTRRLDRRVGEGCGRAGRQGRRQVPAGREPARQRGRQRGRAGGRLDGDDADVEDQTTRDRATSTTRWP